MRLIVRPQFHVYCWSDSNKFDATNSGPHDLVEKPKGDSIAMTVKRTRTHRAIFAFAIAMAPGIGLAACAPSHFDANGQSNPAAPAAGTPAGTTTTAGTSVGSATSTPAPATAAPQQATLLTGTAMLGATPFGAASLRVVDAMTGKALGIVAAGGGNIVAAGGGNYALAQTSTPNVQTDASGNFSLAVTGLTVGHVAQIIATAGGKTVTALISGDGKITTTPQSGQYAVAQANGLTAINNAQFTTSVTIKIVISPTTTIIASTFIPAFLLEGALNPSARAANIAQLMDFIRTNSTPAIEAALLSNPQAALDIETKTDANTGNTQLSTIKSTLASAGITESVKTETNTVVNQVADLSTVQSNLSTGGDASQSLTQDQLSQLGATTNATGGITINGKTIAITPSSTTNPPNTQPPAGTTTPVGTTTLDLSNGSQGATTPTGPLPGAQAKPGTPIVTSTSFNPGVALYYTGGTFTVHVNQPSGQTDIGYIVARIAQSGVYAATAIPQTIGTGVVFDPQAVNSGMPGNLSVTEARVRSSSTNYLSDTTVMPNVPYKPQDVMLPADFGNTLAGSSAKFDGLIENTSAVHVARFQVFDDGVSTFLVTNYALNSGYSMATAGHFTELQTTSLVGLNTQQNVQILMYSRNGERVSRTDTINTSAPPLPQTL
jgi:hypothetical protein